MKGWVILRMLVLQKDVIWQDLATISFLMRGEFPLWSNTKPKVCLVYFFYLFFWESLASLKDMTHTWFLMLDFTECVISTWSDQAETYSTSTRWREYMEKWDNKLWWPPLVPTALFDCELHCLCSLWIETQRVVDKDVVVRVGGGYFQNGILSVSCVLSQLSLFRSQPSRGLQP